MIANLPNILTLARILLLPFFAAAIIYREYKIALIIFIAASVTDLLDGWIARLTKQITYFGSILDPVADKFFLITSFILMSNKGLMPKWLTIIVISKDLIVVTGCIILYFVTSKLEIEPSFWGKAASFCQFILVGLVLVFININVTAEIPMVVFAFVAVLTSVAGIQYIHQGLKAANIDHSN